MSKLLSLPNPTILNFYYYFSTFALALTFFITPILLYIILTQSKTLKDFKWFLINHSFWSLLLEIGIGIFKPVVILPTLSCYIKLFNIFGYFENPYMTIAVLGGCYIVAFICMISVSMTIINRYFTIFPSIFSKYLNDKNLAILGLIIAAIAAIPLSIIFVIFLGKDLKNSYQNSIEYDPSFNQLNESSLMFIPEKYWKPYCKFIYGLFVALVFLSLIAFLYFIYLVRTNLTPTIAKLQKILFISAITQILITAIFLVSPCAMFFTFILFEIPNSASFSCLLFSIMSCHSLVDSIFILTFITPYRKFIIENMNKIFSFKEPIIIKISTAETTGIRSINILQK